MNGFAGDRRWRVGNACLLNATVNNIGRDVDRDDLDHNRAQRACGACATAIQVSLSSK